MWMPSSTAMLMIRHMDMEFSTNNILHLLICLLSNSVLYFTEMKWYTVASVKGKDLWGNKIPKKPEPSVHCLHKITLAIVNFSGNYEVLARREGRKDSASHVSIQGWSPFYTESRTHQNLILWVQNVFKTCHCVYLKTCILFSSFFGTLYASFSLIVLGFTSPPSLTIVMT